MSGALLIMCAMKSLIPSPIDVTGSIPAAVAHTLNGTPTQASKAQGDGQSGYVRVQLEQRTRAWRDWRTQGLGASDAACVLDESPFKSAAGLLEEKLAVRVTDISNAEIELGITLEPEARLQYCRELGVEVEPVCVQSIQYPWLRASLDGLSADGRRVVEIKCGRGAYWRTVNTGRPPAYYVPQLQHILAITGLPSIDFVCYFPGLKTICLKVDRDEVYIERLIAAEKEFWGPIEALRRERLSAGISERAA
jgi:putative phage-type endonuclease